jgi:hypothetical protein
MNYPIAELRSIKKGKGIIDPTVSWICHPGSPQAGIQFLIILWIPVQKTAGMTDKRE